MKLSRSSLSCLLCILLSSNGYSGNLPMDRLLEMSLEDLTNLEITGSTRTAKTIRNVPAAVTVFSQSELRNMGIDFLYELLSFVPGFQTSRDNDVGTSYLYSSRGSDTGQQTSAILLLIDGIPRHEVRTSSASTLSAFMPIARIKRIEVMRGPGSALYGSNAFLGVINIITVDDNNEIGIQAGQPGRQQLQAQMSHDSDQWHMDAFASGYRDDGQHYDMPDRLHSGVLSTEDPQAVDNIAIRAGYKDTQFSAERINLESEDYYIIGTINNDLNRYKQYLNQLSGKQIFYWGDVQSTLQASYAEEQRNLIAQGSLPGAFASISNPSSNDPLIGDVLFESNTALLQWLNDWEMTPATSMQFGVEWKRDDLSTARMLANYNIDMISNRQFPADYSAAGDIYSKVIETGNRETTSVYGQLQHQIDDLTDVIVGLRYDNYSAFDDHLSPRLAIVRQVGDQSSLKLLLGEAYRAPSFLQFSVKENLVLERNPHLKAETIRTSELIWTTGYNKLNVSAGAFYNTLYDRIDSATFSNGKRTNINQETQYSAGMELEASVQFNPQWLLRTSYTNFTKLPDASFREAERLASFILNYHRDRLNLNLAGYYNSERSMPPAGGGDKIDTFTLLNTQISYQLADNIQINLQVKNLTDEDAASAPQSLRIDAPIPYRGRETSVGFNYRF